ncbi:MAG: hypothetical protein H7288_05465 [Kineosporiaceae bacterium]|nr:hypothetical protein [Aeromicrobium sp.]
MKVHAAESAVLAAERVQGTCGIHSIPQVVQVDRGTPTTSKTLGAFRERFDAQGEARTFVTSFVEGAIHTHRHTNFGLNIPADVHCGVAANEAIKCCVVLAVARTANPERCTRMTDPKILASPGPNRIDKAVTPIAPAPAPLHWDRRNGTCCLTTRSPHSP